MSDGIVYHQICGGEMIYKIEINDFICEKCGLVWDGRKSGIVTYDPA